MGKRKCNGIELPSQPLCNVPQGSEIRVGKKKRYVDGDVGCKKNEMAIRGEEKTLLNRNPLDNSMTIQWHV